jgi:hypothetical protein
MLANVLTKPIGGELFHSMARHLLSRHYLSNRGAKDNTSSNGADDKPELAAVTTKVIHGLAELSCSNQYPKKHDMTTKESESPHRHVKHTHSK